MIILAVILLLLATPLVMLIIRLIWPDFVYHWLVAGGCALATWVLTLIARADIPQTIPLINARAGSLFPSELTLLADRLSWPYMLALTTLALSVILTDVLRAPDVDWPAWAGSLFLTALGLLAVLAGNPLTLLLAWMAVDLGELLILLGQVEQSPVRERVVVVFSARVMGSVLLIVAGMINHSVTGEAMSFVLIPRRVGLFLLLAAGLRLGVFPMHLPFLSELPLRRGLGTMIRLVPAAAALALVARTAAAEMMAAFSPILFVLAGLAAVYAGVVWAVAEDELDGRPAWLLGTASLAVGAAVVGQPAASLAWGMAALFCGGLIFLTAVHHRYISWLTLLGVVGISGLPYTSLWSGMLLFVAPFRWAMLLFVLAQVLLVVGYLNHALRSHLVMGSVERWVWLIYPFGLGLLPVMHFLFGLWTNPGGEAMPVFGWWGGVVALGLAAPLMAWITRSPRFPQAAGSLMRPVMSLNWLYAIFWSFYRLSGRLIAFITQVLEGEGGVLWALLILALMLLVLTRAGGV